MKFWLYIYVLKYIITFMKILPGEPRSYFNYEITYFDILSVSIQGNAAEKMNAGNSYARNVITKLKQGGDLKKTCFLSMFKR